MRKSLILASAAMLALVIPVQALNTRTWVSGKGIDQNGCGAVANPCRTLQFAHDQTSSGGEIDVLDPAGYGSLAISKSISIINDGVGVAGLFAVDRTQAIAIESDQFISVLLRGLTINGPGSKVAAVTFVANGSLTIQNCLFRNSGGFIAFSDAPSSIKILNSTFSDSVAEAIAVTQSGNSQTSNPLNILIDQTTVTGNALYGIHLTKLGSSSTSFVLSNSTVSSNGTGIFVDYRIDGVVSSSTIAQNGVGIWANSSSVILTGNTIQGNYRTGVEAREGMKSFGDNKIAGNVVDVFGTLTPVAAR